MTTTAIGNLTTGDRSSEIIARLQKADGDDRDLDRAILEAISDFREIYPGYYEMGGGYYSRDGDEKNPAYPMLTWSIDAALSLMPEGFVANFGNDVGPCWAAVWRDVADYDGYPHQAQAPSMALALCIAALRARAASTAEAHRDEPTQDTTGEVP